MLITFDGLKDRLLLLRLAPRLVFALAAVIGGASCAGMQSGRESLMAKDIRDIKSLVQGQKDESGSRGRKVEYRLDQLDEKVQTRSDQMKASVTDLDKIIRSQSDEISKLHKQVDELGYQLASISGRAGMQSAEGSSSSSP